MTWALGAKFVNHLYEHIANRIIRFILRAPEPSSELYSRQLYSAERARHRKTYTDCIGQSSLSIKALIS
jgi:hypothetical protein